MFYSATRNGFFDPSIFGPSHIEIVDPDWVRPRKSVTLEPGENIKFEDGGDIKFIENLLGYRITLDDIPDMSFDPPMILVANPSSRMPSDAVSLSDEYYAALLAGNADGKVIVADENGYPVLADPPAPTLAEINAARAAAYRDEADPLFFKVMRGEAEKEEWLAKVAEIKERYPKPE